MADLTFTNGFLSEDEKEAFDDCKRTFLLTYSKADLTRFPTCKDFAEIIIAATNEGDSKRKLEMWACCIEPHKDGSNMHYHMAVKFTGARRWKPIWRSIYRKHQISVDFALDAGSGYIAAYRYVAKNKAKEDILFSDVAAHSKLDSMKSPKTKKAMNKNHEKARKRRSSAIANLVTVDENPAPAPPPTKKPKRLSNYEVGQFVVKNNIKSELELMAVADERAAAMEPDLANFIYNKSPQQRRELIKTAWDMHTAKATFQRQSVDRISLIHQSYTKPCECDQENQWFDCAIEVLRNNNTNVYVFANALREAFIKGRQKNNNIFICGPTNCGKSFLLNPIEVIFDAFMNPATGRYALTGLDEKEVAFFNDFRWNPEIIAWSDFLLLLEGQTVHLPRPKNNFATDMVISRHNTIPIFATSKQPIEFVGKFNVRDDRETDMMASRWKVFEFTYQMEREEIIEMEPCRKCFARLVLQGAEKD